MLKWTKMKKHSAFCDVRMWKWFLPLLVDGEADGT